jgi:PAS domain S-box-containing protein
MKNRIQFKHYLIQTFLFVAIIPLAITALLTLPNLFSHLQKDAYNHNISLAHAVASQTRLFLLGPKLVMSVIIEDLYSHKTYNAKFVESVLEDAIHSAKLFDALYLLNEQSKIVAIGMPKNRQVYRSDYIGMQMGDKPYIKKTINSQQSVWSNTFLSATSGITSVALAMPLRNKHILVAEINLSQLSSFLLELQSNNHTTSIILDHLGQVIAHPIKKFSSQQINLSHLELVQSSLTGKNQSLEFDLEGEKYYGSAIPITELGWIAMVYENKNNAYEQINKTINYFVLVTILALFGSFWLAIYLSQRIAHPVENLVKYANHIAKGEYKQKFPHNNFNELNQLSHSMSLMTDSIAIREQQLEAGEKRYLSIFNATSDALIILDAKNSKIIDINSRMLQLYQYDRQTALNKNFPDLSSPIQHDIESFILEQFSKAKQDQQVIFEWLAKNSHNQTFPVEISLSHAEVDNRDIIIASVRNIQQRKEAEKEIEKTNQRSFHQEKMAALGQMVAGVLHEIGNPISAISGVIEQLQQLNLSHLRNSNIKQLKTDNLYFLEMIKAHSDRLTVITNDVANFVSPQINETEFFDLNSTIQQSQGLLRGEKKLKNIEIIYILDKNISAVSGVRDQIVQIFLNLVLNASSACNAVLDRNPTIRIITEMNGHFAVLSICDNGIGMSDEVQKNALTPFFTTKKAGSGTGLGLSLCKTLIEEQNGEMEIISIVGMGTEVRVYIPALTENF